MAGIQIPPGGTWFDTHKKSFVNVPIDPKDQGIATSEFLEAAESTTTLFGATPRYVKLSNGLADNLPFPDLLGSVAFVPVKNDMLGNIKVGRRCPFRSSNV